MQPPQPQPQLPENPDSSATFAPSLVRTYRVWQGDNKFLFGGRLIFGPDVKIIFVSIFLIVAPVAVFCAMVARKLLDDFPHHAGWSIMAVIIALTLFVLINLLVTSGSDPGIVPRNAHPPEPDDYHATDNGSNGQSPLSCLPLTKDVIVNGITVKVKYCDTCMLYRPPRTSHCSVCDNCVERFDHHCPWVGQCIGLRNYRFFYMFVFSATLLCLYVHAFCWVSIRRIKDSEEISIWKAMTKTPASIALIIYTFFFVWFVGGLTVFHTYLISRNQSTYENAKYPCDPRDNPYNRGIINNFKEIFCTRIPPSKNNFRSKVPRESLDLYQRTGIGPLRPMMRTTGNMELVGSSVHNDPHEGESDYRDEFGSEAPSKESSLHNPLLEIILEPMNQMRSYNEPNEEESGYRDGFDNEAPSKESSLAKHPLLPMTLEEPMNQTRSYNKPSEVESGYRKGFDNEAPGKESSLDKHPRWGITPEEPMNQMRNCIEPNEEESGYRDGFDNEAPNKSSVSRQSLWKITQEKPMNQMTSCNEPNKEESGYRVGFDNEAPSKESSLGRHPLWEITPEEPMNQTRSFKEPNREESGLRDGFDNEAPSKESSLDRHSLGKITPEEPMNQTRTYNESNEKESDYRDEFDNEAQSKESSLSRHPL
ncbi:S-acyltransferase 7 [Spatholobus suberectus]|nr:S-acyltransferase 7 [Spatholobus suberectus]